MIDDVKPTPELTTVKARELLGLLVIVLVGIPIVLPGIEIRLVEAIVSLASYVFLAWVIRLHCSRTGVTVLSILGQNPSRKELRDFVLLSIPLVGLSLAGLYAVYLPLSWVKPGWVSALFEDIHDLIVWSSAPVELVSNILNIASVIVVAPIVEEIFFRGFLLNRWWEKYGLEKAIGLSSLVFGLVHIEVIGGIVFGLVLSRLYIKTKSLTAPIIVHMSNNALAVVILIVEATIRGEVPKFTLAEFEAYWWTAPVGLAIGLAWLTWFYRNYLLVTTSRRVDWVSSS